MKKTTKFLAFLTLLALFVTALPLAVGAAFDEKTESYDDYGYYMYFDFENYGSSASHEKYMENDASKNADGRLCDPFGNVIGDTKTDGTGELIAEENGNRYYSFTNAGTSNEASMGIFGLGNGAPGNLIIGDAVEISFRFRMHADLGTEQGIAEGDLMPLLTLRRGAEGNVVYLYADVDGNLYNTGRTLVYTNTAGDDFMNISLKWYDVTNTATLVVDNTVVYEAMPMGEKNYRAFVTPEYDDDFSLTALNQTSTSQRAFELCRASNSTKGKAWGYDFDDIKVSRVETAQNGAICFDNGFDTANNGLSQKSTANNVFAYGSSATLGHGSENGNGYLTVSGNYFGIKDTYHVLSSGSFVTEFKVKGSALHTEELKNLVHYIITGDNTTNVNYYKLLYVDKDGKLYMSNSASTLINGYTLNENDWLDVTIVANKYKASAGKFGQITDKTNSTSNMVYCFSYFINGEYVGTTDYMAFNEWNKGRTASGYTTSIEKKTVDGKAVTALDTSSLTVVDSTTTKNHVIYKSVEDGVPTYYDVETVDGVQKTYSVMTLTKSNFVDSLRFSSSSFELKVDDLKIYEGTCPEWFYESLYSENGGSIWEIDFSKLARTTTNNVYAMTDAKGDDVTGTVFNNAFFSRAYNQTAHGDRVYFDNTYLDFFIPSPTDDPDFSAELRFKVGLKNITDAAAKDGKWEIGLFNHRFENAAGNYYSSASLMYVGNESAGLDLSLYGYGRLPLYNRDGTPAKLDNENGSVLYADLFVNRATDEYTVSYYLDGNPLYLEDGSTAHRIGGGTLQSRYTTYFGVTQNHRVRFISLTGSCYVDVTEAGVSVNPVETYRSETAAEKIRANGVNAFELELSALPLTDGTSRYYDVIKLTKTGGELTLVSVIPSTGELVVGSAGKYYRLSDAEGNIFTLSDSASKIAVVYDDVNGDARYYVDSAPAYVYKNGAAEAAIDLPVYDTAFAGISSAASCELLTMGEDLKLSDYGFAYHEINDGDRAELIGFQESTVKDGIRIIAGVDSLYYSKAGFEIEIYEDGVLVKSDDVSSRTVFSSIIANNEVIGEGEYSYFSTLNVTDLPDCVPDNSYILVRAYTEVLGVKHYDEQAKICVTDEGYFFEGQGGEDSDDSETYEGKQIVLLLGQSNMSGRGKAEYVDPIYDKRITAFYSDEGWVTMTEPIHKDASNPIGLSASFAKAFVETFDCELGLVPLAVGGTSLNQWTKGYSGNKDYDLYETAVETAKEAMKSGEICAILWHQGESDRTSSSSTYITKFKPIMDALIEDLGLDRNKIAIITGELCDRNDPENYPIVKVNTALNSDELKNYFPKYGVASAQGLTNNELKDSHFDAPSLRVFGYRYFEQFYKLTTGKDCPYEFSNDPLDYKVEPNVVESKKDSYYIADFDFNGYTEGAVLSGISIASTASVSTGVDKYVIMPRTLETDPGILVTAVPTPGEDVVVEMDLRLSEGFQFKSDNVSGALIKLTPASGTSIVLVRIDQDGYILDNVTRERVGEPLAPDEWTTVKVVCHMDTNTKDVYVNGTGYKSSLLGTTLHATFDTTTFATAKITVGQIGKILTGTLEFDNIKVYESPRVPSEISDSIKLLGRAFELGNGIALDHSASGFAFNYNGSGNVVINMTASDAIKLAVKVDGVLTKNVAVPKGTSDVLIAKDLEAGDHTVEVVKESDVKTTAEVNAIAFTGKLLDRPADTETYIEFIGDSITAGYGLSEDAEGDHHDATLSYAYRTAGLLESDYAIFARSGMGIAYASGNVNIFENRYPYLSYVRNTTDMYDPDRTPDLVVVNLAQNDNNQWKTEGGNQQGDKYNDDSFDAKFKGMIDTIVGLYGKDRPILFVYGCMESSAFTPLATVRSKYLIDNVYTAENGYNVKYTVLTTNRGGRDNHPTADGALTQAQELAAFISQTYPEF